MNYTIKKDFSDPKTYSIVKLLFFVCAPHLLFNILYLCFDGIEYKYFKNSRIEKTLLVYINNDFNYFLLASIILVFTIIIMTLMKEQVKKLNILVRSFYYLIAISILTNSIGSLLKGCLIIKNTKLVLDPIKANFTWKNWIEYDDFTSEIYKYDYLFLVIYFVIIIVYLYFNNNKIKATIKKNN